MRTSLEWIRHPLVVRCCRLAIGGIFVVAALAKIGDLSSFAEQVHNFRIAPVPLENLLAMTLPWVELLAGLSLTLRVQERAGAWVATALMLVFTAAVGTALARGLDIECGCFGTADASTVGLQKILLNGAMTLLALGAVLRPRPLAPELEAALSPSTATEG
jgi:putative oxidoreductase